MQTLSRMGKQCGGALIALLLLAPRLRADTTVSDGSATNFANALADTITAGGGTIVVTTPILIGDTNDDTGDTFDGQSMVTVSGGSNNAVFIVQSGSLSLTNFTVANGVSTNGGAIYIAEDTSATFTGCIFSNNTARGADGESSGTNAVDGGNTGRNGGRGTAAQGGFGGAIFSLGDLSIFNCQFLTNSAIGGAGGAGGDGGNGALRGGNGGPGGRGGDAIGGGVWSKGTLDLENSTFSGNLALGGDGGTGGVGGGGQFGGLSASGGAAGNAGGAGLYIVKNTNATVTILACTFANNTVAGGGSADGGTSSGGNGLAGPRGGGAFGGGVDNAGLLALTNCTFFQNNANGGIGGNGGTGAGGGHGGGGGNAIGGGLYNTGMVAVVNCTFAQGSAVGGTNGLAGSGIAAGRDGGHGGNFGGSIANVAKKKNSFVLINSIVATNLSGGGGYGTIVDGGYNISADRSIKFKKSTKTSTSLMKTDPLVGELTDNGGPTETIPLALNSPAVDAIPKDLAPTVDQRGTNRPIAVRKFQSDMGAYELDPNAVSILSQSQSTNVPVGSNVTFSVTASGPGTLVYQWSFAGAALTNETNSSFTIMDVQTNNSGIYQVFVSNGTNSATSKPIQLTVIFLTNTPPTITAMTPLQTVPVGSAVAIGVTATGTSPLMYQWHFQNFQDGTTASLSDGGNVSGSASNILSIVNAQTTNSGNYFVVVTNIAGAITSPNSTLSVTNSTDTNVDINPGFEQSASGIGPEKLSRAPQVTQQKKKARAPSNATFQSQLDAADLFKHERWLIDSSLMPIDETRRRTRRQIKSFSLIGPTEFFRIAVRRIARIFRSV